MLRRLGLSQRMKEIAEYVLMMPDIKLCVVRENRKIDK
jgi:hypothetical protein